MWKATNKTNKKVRVFKVDGTHIHLKPGESWESSIKFEESNEVDIIDLNAKPKVEKPKEPVEKKEE